MPLDPLSVPAFARAADYAGVWAIEPTRGAALWDLARRSDLRAHVAETAPPKLSSQVQTVTSRDGTTVAVVMLTGTLMKAVSSMDGGTSTVAARREIRKAAADPDVSAILLAIDSPGGTVSGTADLAAEVKAAAAKKPVWAFADDLAASAAYWVASQADKVFANDRTALVGSIGTLAVVYDLSKAAEDAGVKTLVFGTGPLKGAGAPGAPVTEDQQAYIRGIVEDAQVSFDAAVRRGRGLTDKQLADAKTGGVFGADEAMSRKLIDGIQSFDATVAALASEARKRGRMSSTTRATGSPVRSAVMTENETPAGTAADPVADLKAQMRAEAAAELRRQADIRKVCGDHVDVAAQAIAENWTPEKAELTALRKGLANNVRAAGPQFALNHEKYAPGVKHADVVEAALRMSLGRNVEKDYRAEVLEAADGLRREGIGLHTVFLTAAAQNGYHVGPGTKITAGNLKDVLKAAFPEDTTVNRTAGASTVSLSGILGNVANKELVAGYTEEDDTWREISQTRSASNFQTRTYYRMLDNMEYEEVGPDGKMKSGTVDQESYTASLKTYAKMFALTRRDIINDDLGAFQDLRNRLGRGAKKKFNNLFWTNMLASHSTFFTSARGNYITGATTTLLTDGVGLGLAVKAFRQMKSPSTVGSADDGGKRINARPSILLVPPELEYAADQLFMGEKLNVGSGPGEQNTYRGKYRPVVNAWLSDSGFTGYSTTAWYLFRAAADMAMMLVSFLNGNENPTVESADADFDTLGVQFRGYHDFYADQAEYLCGVKSKGAA